MKVKSARWDLSKNEFYACTVNKITIEEDEKAANYCHRRVGRPYNWNYFDIDTRSKFYCSQLVYSAFKDLFSIDLNTNMFKSPLGNPIHPYELLSSNKTTVIGRYK